jgi:hypothetical protein
VNGPPPAGAPAEVVKPRSQVRTGKAYKIIWNPRPRDFAGQTTPDDLRMATASMLRLSSSCAAIAASR